MYVLERKRLFIPRENLTKNRCFQGFRWAQIAMCEEREPLQKMIQNGKERESCVMLAERIVEMKEEMR